MEKPEKFYKVNNPGEPIYLPLNLAIMDDKDLLKWEAYRNTDAYKGRTQEEMDRNRKIPEPIKIQAWAKRNEIGVAVYKEHTLAPQGDYTRCYELKTGSTFITDRQYEELKKFQKRPIVQKMEYGDTEPQIMYEGFLEITEIPEEDYNKAKAKYATLSTSKPTA